MHILGVTLLLSFCDFVYNSSTSLFRSSPNKNVDTAVDGLHKGAYCFFRSGRMRSLRFRLSSLLLTTAGLLYGSKHLSDPHLHCYTAEVQHINLTRARTVPSGKLNHCFWSPVVIVAKFACLSWVQPN